MAWLRPKDFKHIPSFYRPKRTLRVNKGFAKKVREIKKYGGRSNSGNVGDVFSVLENMRRVTPKVFRPKKHRSTRRI
jgi:hypothetical protein